MTIYAGDPDANVVYAVTDRYSNDLDFTATVIVGASTEITCEWQGDVGPERELKVPLGSLSKGTYSLRLKVPGDNDVPLGQVTIS